MPTIRQYADATDRVQVVELWRKVFGYETAHNEPNLAISKKSPSKMVCFLLQLKTNLSLARSWRATMDIVDGCILWR